MSHLEQNGSEPRPKERRDIPMVQRRPKPTMPNVSIVHFETAFLLDAYNGYEPKIFHWCYSNRPLGMTKIRFGQSLSLLRMPSWRQQSASFKKVTKNSTMVCLPFSFTYLFFSTDMPLHIQLKSVNFIVVAISIIPAVAKINSDSISAHKCSKEAADNTDGGSTRPAEARESDLAAHWKAKEQQQQQHPESVRHPSLIPSSIYSSLILDSHHLLPEQESLSFF